MRLIKSYGKTKVISLRLPNKLIKRLDKEANNVYGNRSEIIRRALIKYWNNQNYKEVKD